MIAEAMVATGWPSTQFGVAPSPELGKLLLEVLSQRRATDTVDGMLADMAPRMVRR